MWFTSPSEIFQYPSSVVQSLPRWPSAAGQCRDAKVGFNPFSCRSLCFTLDKIKLIQAWDPSLKRWNPTRKTIRNIEGNPDFVSPSLAVRDGDWKLHQYFEDGGLELYNLQTDIGETTNVAQIFPEKTKALLERLTQWRRQINAPIPTEANPAFDAQAEAAAIQGKRKSGR